MALARAPPSAMVPSTRTSSPPANATSALLKSGASLDIVTVIPIPARAAYNDHAPPALPALGMTIRFTPSSTARDNPTHAPRALKLESVAGFVTAGALEMRQPGTHRTTPITKATSHTAAVA